MAHTRYSINTFDEEMLNKRKEEKGNNKDKVYFAGGRGLGGVNIKYRKEREMSKIILIVLLRMAGRMREFTHRHKIEVKISSGEKVVNSI